MTTFREALGTIITRIWFFTWVCSHIFLEVIIVRESRRKLLTTIWLFKLVLWEKALGHWLQGYGFSTQCVFKCFFRLTFWEKTFWYRLHGNGFSFHAVLVRVTLILILLNCVSQWWYKWDILLFNIWGFYLRGHTPFDFFP